MKKILSILVMVLLGVTSVWAQDVTSTLKVNVGTSVNPTAANSIIKVGVCDNSLDDCSQNTKAFSVDATMTTPEKHNVVFGWPDYTEDYKNETIDLNVSCYVSTEMLGTDNEYVFSHWVINGDGVSFITQPTTTSGMCTFKITVKKSYLFNITSQTVSSGRLDDRVYTVTAKTGVTSNVTITAVWVQPQVTGVDNANYTLPKITDVNDLRTQDIVFNLANDVAKSNYTCQPSGDGFSLNNTAWNANHTYTATAAYTPSGVHGTHTGAVTLTSNHPSSNPTSATSTLTVEEDYTPAFTMPATFAVSTQAQPTYVGAYTQLMETDIVPTGLNYAAGAMLPLDATELKNGSVWDIQLTEHPSGFFSLEPFGNTKVIRFTPTGTVDANTEYTAKLQVKCTYYDALGTPISTTKDVILTAYAKNDANERLEIEGGDTYTMDFGNTIYGTPYTQTVSYVAINLAQTPQATWTATSDQITYANYGSSISISLSKNLAIGSHTAKLVYTSGSKTVTLNVSANVVLGTPELNAYGGLSQVTLTWTPVYGADKYIIKRGGTTIKEITDPTITSYVDANLTNGTTVSYTIKAVYTADESYNTTSNEATATPNMPTTITAGDVPYIGLYTGTEKYQAGHVTYGKFPYREKRRIDLSAAFKDDKAIFDQLFIFGLTTGDASGNITKADASKGSNASTPCYIFVKNGNNYTLSSTIDNVNVADRPSQFKINVSGGKSYYFTGYSPYTSCGYQWEKSSGNFVNGVFSFVGDKDVNLYFDNLQLYARPKSANGSLTVAQKVFEVNDIGDAGLLLRKDLDGNISSSDVNVKFYTQGSGSAFCFQPIKNGATLQPTIHLKGENILEPTQGVYLIVRVNFVLNFEKEASQHSAPIQVVHNEETIGTSTNLTIDDWWGGERTNGSLNLATQDSRPAPTIDLGSDKTTLNINGGQLFLSNSFNSSTEYDVSYAISYRMKSMLDGLAVIYGLGDDQPGATVLFNDGTINCKPLLSSNFNSTQGQKLFHNPTSMKCPQKTYIRGGSFNCDVLACSTTTSKGASPKNAEGGDNLCLVTIPIETLRANNTATLKPSWKTDVVELGAKPEANIKYNDGVHTGYDYYGIDCMTPQTIKDEGGNDIQVVNLMLPSDLICFKEVLTTDWALCFPKVYVKAIEEKNLGGDIEVDYSISEDDGLTKVVKTSKFLYGELDQYMVNIVGGVSVDGENIKYSVPNEDGDVSITVSLPEDGISKSVTNTQPFAVYDKMYMLMPLVANQWEMFVPPFDVANIYVVETYPEDKLIRDFDETGDGKLTNTENHHEMDKARYAQSDRMMDLLYQWLWSVKVLNSTADIWYKDGSLWGFMLDWLDLYKDLDSKPTSKTCLQQLYHYHPTATYPSGKYWWDANFYLYQAVGDTWDYDNGELQVKWEEVPTISQPRNTAGKHNVIMKKGQVYVMSFPSTIVNNEIYDYVNTWDYWTGKYIII